MIRVAGVSGYSAEGSTIDLPVRIAGVSAYSTTPWELGARVAHVRGVSFQTPQPVWFIDYGDGWVPFISTTT